MSVFFVKFSDMGSMGQLHSSIRECKYRSSKSIFSDSLFANIVTGIINVFNLGCCSVFTGDIISYFSRMSRGLFTLSFKCLGTLLEHCFSVNFGGECKFLTSIFDVAQTMGRFSSNSANYSNSCCSI